MENCGLCLVGQRDRLTRLGLIVGTRVTRPLWIDRTANDFRSGVVLTGGVANHPAIADPAFLFTLACGLHVQVNFAEMILICPELVAMPPL